MALSLDALVVLDAIDRRGSFAAAAAALDRVPSAVTYTVRRLEDDLDVLLFDRRGRRAVLTAAGRELLDHGRSLLAEAAALEQRVQRIATGWEAELRVAVDGIVPFGRVWPLARAFYEACRAEQAAHTRLRLSAEVLGGTWDALVEQRADLVLGAPSDPPPGGGFRIRVLADIPMVFAVARSHPLAGAAEPLGEALLARHRVVVAADSSRHLPPRTVGLLTGQDTLTVPDLNTKLAAQVAGLGIGTLPWYLAAPEIEAGRLVAKTVENPRGPIRIVAAWRERHPGHALAWWIDAIERADWRFLAAAPAVSVGDTAPVTARRRPRR